MGLVFSFQGMMKFCLPQYDDVTQFMNLQLWNSDTMSFQYQIFIGCQVCKSINKTNLLITIQQNSLGMRYQARAQKSYSFVHNKENKENNDTSNLHPYRPRKEPFQHKLQKKISDSTAFASTVVKVNLTEDLKKTYSKLIADDYSSDILDHLILQSKNLDGFLDNHGITPALRSKMVDWMIEVLSSYKMTEETFFRSVHMMDTYLKYTNQAQELKDLHLIGVTSMFCAAKYQEIHPFKLSVMYEKIARKKFSKSQILQKQSSMISSLGFFLENVHLYDLVKHLLHQVDFGIQRASLKYLQQIALYLSKMCVFDQSLVEEQLSLVAGAVIYISLKTLEQTDKAIKPQNHLGVIECYLKVEDDRMIQTSKRVLELAKSFSKIYPNLGNLKRFNKFEYQQEE